MKFRDRLRKEQTEKTLEGLELPVKLKQSIFGVAEQYNQLLKKLVHDRDHDISEYQKELARLENEHQEKTTQWQKTEHTLTRECHEADKAKAIAQTRAEGYLTQIEALKKELKSK